jgi:EAL and modified HD-GYP domain-containing signal transduction protein
MYSYIARQPIFNHKLELYGYELLFRGSLENYMPDIDGDLATSHVISNSFINVNIDQITGGKRAFINFTEKLLKDRTPMILPRKTAVIEILENIVPDDELIEACKELRKNGYVIALDDFKLTDAAFPLVELADIIKIDFLLSPIDEITRYIKQFPKKVKLLAEKIETHDVFKQAESMGFTLFQGYFFSKPEVLKTKSIPSSKLSVLKVMIETNKDDFNYSNVENYISTDLGLSYKLLRYINTAHFAPKQRIDSVKDALVYMGTLELKRFMNVISILQLNTGKTDELINLSCQRAKMCELMGKVCKVAVKHDELFTLGIFSLVDAILDKPMSEVMEKLPLCNELKDALVQHKGPIYPFLNLVKQYEAGNWTLVHQISTSLKLSPKKLVEIYEEACEWSNNLLKL